MNLTSRGIVAVLALGFAAATAAPDAAAKGKPATGGSGKTAPAKSGPKDIVSGTAKNGMPWHVRMPSDGAPATKERPAIVIFHGSNGRSMDYVFTIANAWPQLRDDYVLIGLDGERAPKSTPEEPYFNYTYVTFEGKSTMHYGGDQKQSPALVVEALAELKEKFHVSRFFVGGHSQGGFLTYFIAMHYPDLIAGAFPISGGMTFQCEPTAFDDEKVREAQRRLPIAIVHAKNDPVVEFGMSRYAIEAYEDQDFPLARLFAPADGQHMFAMLPVDEAIRWLETMASKDAGDLVAYARKRIEEDPRDAAAALVRARIVDEGGKQRAAIEAVEEHLEAAAKAKAPDLEKAIRANKDAKWVDDFFDFRSKYATTAAAKGVLSAYESLRDKHQRKADALWAEARGAFQSGAKDKGYKAYEEVVAKWYASSWYRLAKHSLDERK